jgi:hypothetical protein
MIRMNFFQQNMWRTARRAVPTLFLLLLFVSAGPAATITFNVTNSVGQPDTTPFQILPLSTPLVVSNSYFVTGLAIQLTPDTNGYCQTNLMIGEYAVTNRFFVNQFSGQSSRGVIFVVTNSVGTYNFASLVVSNACQFAWNPFTNGVFVSTGTY